MSHETGSPQNLAVEIDDRASGKHFYRIILATFVIAFSLSCSRTIDLTTPDTTRSKPGATPIPQMEAPSDWKTFEIGPFTLSGPADLKDKKVRGIDSSVYLFENEEFSVGIEVGSYSGSEPNFHSYEFETGLVQIGDKMMKFEKVDVNKPNASAARNADGSKQKPIDKHLSVTTWISEERATIGVSYRYESSTPQALTMLQTIRVKQTNDK